jgi:hypothetical protein
VKSLLETYEKGEEEHDRLASILQQLELTLNTINKEKAKVLNKRQLIFYNYNLTGYGFIDDFTSNQNMKYIRESEVELAPFKVRSDVNHWRLSLFLVFFFFFFFFLDCFVVLLFYGFFSWPCL